MSKVRSRKRAEEKGVFSSLFFGEISAAHSQDFEGNQKGGTVSFRKMWGVHFLISERE